MTDDRNDFLEDDLNEDDDSTVAVAFDGSDIGFDLAREQEGAFLTVIAGNRVGEMVRVDKETPMTVGRGQDTTLRINDAGASKEHCRFTMDEEGKVFAADLKSTNGTRVNGEPIEKVELNDGDKIHIGSSTILKFAFADSLDESFQQRMYEAALRDPLTGLYNRRHLTGQLETEFSYAWRHGLPLSFVMVDLDHFKQVNDTYGHLTGDAVLRGFGQRLAGAVRREDFAARYGGEEFAILCRQTNVELAMGVAERLRRMIEQASLVPEQPEVRVTISLGVSGIPHPEIGSAIDLINTADRALYEAKRSGRNQVCLFNERPGGKG